MVHLRELQENYVDRIQIVFVYIREAGHETEGELKKVVAEEDRTQGQRHSSLRLAREGMKHYRLSFPCLLDDADETVSRLYRAFPMRLLLIDAEGKIALDSGLPLYGSVPWDKIRNWIAQSVPAPASLTNENKNPPNDRRQALSNGGVVED